MKEIDQMLKQWIPVNTIIRDKFRNIIIKYAQEKMDEAYKAGREFELINNK